MSLEKRNSSLLRAQCSRLIRTMVGPIDLIVNLGQTITVAQSQQAKQQEPVHRQEFLGIKFGQETHHKEEQVQRIEKPEHPMRVEEREGGGRGKERRRKREEKEKEEKGEASKEETLGHFVDFKG